jgi:hypothetical protein
VDHTASSRIRAVASQMANLIAGVAAAACGAVQTEGWAISLNMAEALAVVALLGLSRSRMGARV